MNSGLMQKARETMLILTLAALLAGCSGGSAAPTPQNTVTPAPPPTRQPTALPTQGTPAPAATPTQQPTPQITIGGRQINEGHFTFDLRIYSDMRLNKNPADSSQYSDLEGFGEYMTWVYNGPPITGVVYEFWGVQPNITQLNSYQGLNSGASGGRSGGIFLPGGPYIRGSSKPGDLITLVYRMETPQGKIGATLTFTLKKTSTGLAPTNIVVRALGPNQ